MTYAEMEIRTREVRVRYHSSSETIPGEVRDLFNRGIRNGFVNGYLNESIPIQGESGVHMTDLACVTNPSFYSKAADFIKECDGVEAIVSVEILGRNFRE